MVRALDWEPETPGLKLALLQLAVRSQDPLSFSGALLSSKSLGARLNILGDFLWLACAMAIQGQLLSGAALSTSVLLPTDLGLCS